MINNSLSESRRFLELYSLTKSLCTIDLTWVNYWYNWNISIKYILYGVYFIFVLYIILECYFVCFIVHHIIKFEKLICTFFTQVIAEEVVVQLYIFCYSFKVLLIVRYRFLLVVLANLKVSQIISQYNLLHSQLQSC